MGGSVHDGGEIVEDASDIGPGVGETGDGCLDLGALTEQSFGR